MKRVLITTTSFQDTPGEHHKLLAEAGWELVTARGPLSEEAMYDLAGEVDAFICGDDLITRRVMEKGQPQLKIISKYGIGVDKIDVAAATELGIPVLFTPGVNHTTVAEHAFLLMLSLAKHMPYHLEGTRAGSWKRKTGTEIMGKTIGIMGMGRIGREVAVRAKAFGMRVAGYDLYWDAAFAEEHGVYRAEDVERLFGMADIISLHVNLNAETRDLVRKETLAGMKKGVWIINCARGEIVRVRDLLEALEEGRVGGYATDVLDEEPPSADHPLLRHANCIVTPHIGSRTFESVQRQAVKAVTNLQLAFNGEKPLAQVNDVPLPQPD